MNTTGTTLTTASPAPMAKAAALLASGGVQPTNRDGVWKARSSDGKSWYLCSPSGNWCYCPARVSACCHIEAARMAVCEQLRARAAAMGIRVLLGHSGAEPVGADAPAGDLYGNDISEGE
jgi:hypothetical protein